MCDNHVHLHHILALHAASKEYRLMRCQLTANTDNLSMLLAIIYRVTILLDNHTNNKITSRPPESFIENANSTNATIFQPCFALYMRWLVSVQLTHMIAGLSTYTICCAWSWQLIMGRSTLHELCIIFCKRFRMSLLSTLCIIWK